MDFGRLITAMVTPFSLDGEVDFNGIDRIVEHLIATGTTAIVACGTTGESPTLSHKEKLGVFERTLAAAKGRIPVIVGTGSNNTRESLELSKEAAQLGVQGLLLVTPYYNKPTQEGLIAHFSAIADAVDTPIMLYNVPGRSSTNMLTDTVLKLAEIPHVFSVKEASGDMTQIMQIAAEKPDDFLLYSGDDKLTLPLLAIGAYGVVSVASHVVGPEMTDMIEAFISGNIAKAALWNARLLSIFETLFASSSPNVVKAGLDLLGHSAGSVRLPLVSAPDNIIKHLRELLQRLGKIE